MLVDADGIQQARTELLRRAGHGARNCLNGVVGLSELFRRPGAAPDPAAGAAMAESAVELRSLLQPLIDIAIADPCMPNAPTAVPVRMLLQEVVAFHALLARGRQVGVSFEVAEGVAPTVRTDRLNFALLVHLATARVVAACAERGQVRILAEPEAAGLRLTFTASPSAAPSASVQADFLGELADRLGASVTALDLQGAAAIRATLPAR